jgi:hypothetical protein
MKNGLYSIHVQLGDGREGKGSGVLTFNEGVILGGDAFLYYTGRYFAEKSIVRGEVIVRQHTPSIDENPLFAASGGSEVGIGFSGSFTDVGASVSGTALVGRHSMIFRASLRRLTTVDGTAEFSLQKGVLSPVA